MWKHRWYILPLLLVWMAGSSWWYICKIKKLCGCENCDTQQVTSVTSNAKGNLNIADSSWNLNIPDDFLWGKNGAAPAVSATMQQYLDSLQQHISLAGAGKKTISLTGLYTSAEKYNGNFANLGVARAEAVKQLLAQRGLPEGNIFTNGKIKEDLPFAANDSTYQAINFNIANVGAAMSEDLLFEPRIIYFETGKNSLQITDELSSYFTQADAYLKTHGNDKLSITGFTDNKGDSLKNEKLSKERAGFVQTELGKKGIVATQTTVEGKGQQNPIGDNTTDEGRQKNRRVEVVLVKAAQ